MHLLLAACLLAPAEAPKPAWLTDLSAAQKRAKAEKRPLFVVFRCDH